MVFTSASQLVINRISTYMGLRLKPELKVKKCWQPVITRSHQLDPQMELNRVSNEITSNQIETIRLTFIIRFSGRADHQISIGRKIGNRGQIGTTELCSLCQSETWVKPASKLGSDFCKLLPNAKGKKTKLCRSKSGFVIKPSLFIKGRDRLIRGGSELVQSRFHALHQRSRAS